MSTIRQKKLAKAFVANITSDNPKNKGELLESVGYASSVAQHKPQEILEQEGVLVELAGLGFTEENAKFVVGSILSDDEAEHRDRLKAASEVFKVSGSYAPEKHENINVNVELTQRARELADRLLQRQRG